MDPEFPAATGVGQAFDHFLKTHPTVIDDLDVGRRDASMRPDLYAARRILGINCDDARARIVVVLKPDEFEKEPLLTVAFVAGMAQDHVSGLQHLTVWGAGPAEGGGVRASSGASCDLHVVERHEILRVIIGLPDAITAEVNEMIADLPEPPKAEEPRRDVGICGDLLASEVPWTVCVLAAGHAGWHRSDDDASWTHGEKEES